MLDHQYFSPIPMTRYLLSKTILLKPDDPPCAFRYYAVDSSPQLGSAEDESVVAYRKKM